MRSKWCSIKDRVPSLGGPLLDDIGYVNFIVENKKKTLCFSIRFKLNLINYIIQKL